MRFWTAAAAIATFAALVTAQQNAINIPAGQSTLDITAGQEQTITWSDPSSGTVTIKLQQQPVTPGGGTVLVSNVPASAGTASFLIQPDQVNSFQYTIEIVDDTNPNNYNFSPNFGVKGATGTSTGSASTASATDSSSATGSTDTSSTTATDSSSSSMTGSSMSSSASETGSSTTSGSSSSSSPTSQKTSAPNSNAAAAVKISGALLAMVAAGVVVAL